ncbi:MAG: homoserine kinase [Burkholderiales bacterium]
MSVFTTVTEQELSEWLKGYSVGHLTELQGIAAGIENTNYFVTTTQARFVLTLFERLKPSELPFYLNLMAHLSNHGLPCPKPIANLSNQFLGHLNGKPAALATRLSGAPVMQPTAAQCAQVGEMLADLHLAGLSYPGHLDNLRGTRWWTETAPALIGLLAPPNRTMLASEVSFQARQDLSALPRGVVHADLFRDNVLFDGDRIGGVVDFFFACVDVWLYDVAITVNDWCMTDDFTLDLARTRALLDAYHGTRSFTDAERVLWPVLLRAGALRFWVSRLHDFHLPRPGDLTHAHDPSQFERILRSHIEAGGRPDLQPPLVP